MKHPNFKCSAKVPELTPGDYYSNKRREAEEIAEHLREVKARGGTEEEIQCLERLLEQACYVGD
jgi:hypothetical protein